MPKQLRTKEGPAHAHQKDDQNAQCQPKRLSDQSQQQSATAVAVGCVDISIRRKELQRAQRTAGCSNRGRVVMLRGFGNCFQ